MSTSSQFLSRSYGFDAGGRLLSVSDGTNSATYGYLANSPLVSQISFTNGSVQRMVTTKQHDLLNRLTNISSVSSVQSVVNSGYAVNSANQRTRRTELDSSYWSYQYDSFGQVTSGKKYWSDGTPVAGQQFEFSFDDIGNRKTTAAGGDQFGSNLRSATYSANNLNQYTGHDFPGYVNDLGTASSNATVTLWSSDGSFAQAYRRGEYLRAELPVNNSTGAVWLTLTNLAVLQNGTNADILTSVVGNALLPKTPQAFIYDADGNLLSDGIWTNTWDSENRLLSMQSTTAVSPAARRLLRFRYDAQGRRVRKSVDTFNPATLSYESSTAILYLYDGWNLIAEIDNLQSLTNFVRSYTWGLDLSGSMQGAGGVGGLLAITDRSDTNHPSTHFVASDGNGNVSALVNATTGTNSANYEYGPFGELIRATGPMAFINPFRFSTKFQDDETAFLYYGYRYYDPSTGRWVGKDPIGEQPALSLYSMLGNDPIDHADLLGWLDYQWRYLGGPVVTSPGANVWPPFVPPPAYTVGANATGQTLVKVNKCNVVIFFGHGVASNYSDGTPVDFGKLKVAELNQVALPSLIQNEPCSAAGVLGCNTGNYVRIETPVPGAPAPKAEINFAWEAGPLIDKAWAAAKAKATTICKDPNQCCREVRVRFECPGMSYFQKPAGWCGKEEIVKCH